MAVRPMMRRCGAALMLGLALLSGARLWASNEEVEARMRRDITYLASDECEGRGPGTKGIDKAADHIAGEFKKAGLKPGGTAGYFQPFTIFEGVKQDSPATMRLRGPLGQEIVLRPGFD